MAALATDIDVRRHIEWKRDTRELRDEWAERMLAAIDAGAEPDYLALLRDAQWPEPPAVVFHTAPCFVRDDVRREGLRVSQPGTGNWIPRPGCIAIQADQPVGVYAAPEPDLRGVWAHWSEWDVWAIDLAGLPWEPDPINPGYYVVPQAVPAARLRLAHEGVSW